MQIFNLQGAYGCGTCGMLLQNIHTGGECDPWDGWAYFQCVNSHNLMGRAGLPKGKPCPEYKKIVRFRVPLVDVEQVNEVPR